MRIIDFHTHAFPDDIARRAISKLEENSNVPAETDGTVAGLIRLMDKCGIEKSLIMSIATKAKQFTPILDWSVGIRTDRIIPFASVYPDSPTIAEEVAAIKAAGIKGIKLHPMYQNFNVDDRRVFPPV